MSGAPLQPAPLTGPVRLDRHGAVGWRDVALDGLNCYLRGIEAILRASGFGHDEVVDEMGGPVTDRFSRDGRPLLQLRKCAARWLIAPAGADHWDEVSRRLAGGEPVVLWPDGFYWPGGRFEGRRHIFNHAVLVVGIEGGTMHYLDIEAEESKGLAGAVPITEATKRACARVLRLEVVAPVRPLRARDVERMIRASIRPLCRLARATAEYADWWAIAPTRRLATALDLWALSDVQPPVYLLSCVCRRFGYEPLARLGFEAAAQAKKASLFVGALHQCRPVAPYDLCRDDIVVLSERLHAVARAAMDAVPDPPQDGEGRDGPWLWRRLNALSRWHLDVGIGSLDAHLSSDARRGHGRMYPPHIRLVEDALGFCPSPDGGE